MSIFRESLSHVHHLLGQGQVGHVRWVGVVVVRVLGVAHRLLSRVPLVGTAKVSLAVFNVPAQGDEALQGPPEQKWSMIILGQEHYPV